MMRWMLPLAAMLCTISAPAAAQQCWAVERFPEARLAFFDLDRDFYIEYRDMIPVTPPPEVNPGNFRVHIAFRLYHRIESGETFGSAITGELRTQANRIRIPAADMDQLFEIAEGQSGDRLTVTDHDTTGLWWASEVGARNRPSDAALGRALHDRLANGGSAHIVYRVESATLNVQYEGEPVFPADALYQAEIHARARELATQRRETGRCPFPPRR